MRYLAEDDAPKVLARGFGRNAERIRELARQSGVDIHTDADLALALSRLDLDMEIPPELYEAVAQVLSYIYFVNEQALREKP